jgi:GAF domain-containing protein
MYDFKIEAADKATLYTDLASALEGLVAGEPDAIANMANAAALIWETLPDINWVGFYRNVGGELIVGPFQGRPACIRIAFGDGMCGAAAATRQVQRIDDVHAFPGHIACDSASNSEIVVPILRDGELLAVLDIDSPTRRFDAEDGRSRLRLAGIMTKAIRLNASNCSSVSDPGMIIRIIAGVIAGEMGDRGPGFLAGAAPSNSAATSSRDMARGPLPLASCRTTIRRDPGGIHDFADRGGTIPSCAGAAPPRSPPDPAPLDEILRSTTASTSTSPSVLAARRAASAAQPRLGLSSSRRDKSTPSCFPGTEEGVDPATGKHSA